MALMGVHRNPAACKSNPSIYEHFTRDPERLTFQWNNEKNHLKVFKSLQDLRGENPL